jgi:WD40 repeat protein
MKQILLFMLVILVLFSTPAKAQSTEVPISSIDWSLDGSLYAAGYMDGRVEVSTPSGQVLKGFQIGHFVNVVTWNPVQPSMLAVAGGDPGNFQAEVHIVDIETERTLFVISEMPYIRTIVWNPEGNLLAVAVDDMEPLRGNLRIDVWDISNQKNVQEILVWTSITSLDWHPYENLIASSGADFKARVWDVDTGLETLLLEGHTALVGRVQWNYDGTRLATTSELGDETVRVWDAKTGEVLHIYEDIYALSLQWKPYSNDLLIAEADQVQIFDTTGTKSPVKVEFPRFTSVLDFSPYGGRLAAESKDSPIVIVPQPTLDQLSAVSDLCVQNALKPLPRDNMLSSVGTLEVADLPAFIAQVEALPADTLPAACRADLLAVAEAVTVQQVQK